MCRNWFTSKSKYENLRNCEECGILTERRIPKFELLEPNFSFGNFLIFKIVKFRKFVNFSIWNIPKMFQISQYQKCPKFYHFENVPNVAISKIVKFPLLTNLQINRISEIVQFQKLANFPNLTIWKTPNLQNSKNLKFGKLLYISNVRITHTLKK